ncbi:hypothetical protein PROFUN_03966 [Planoprotostelium fungivorum]|uniref:PITH domain-containing protein n=1 Tax=Planoprotostelium fungivorum TaxID=1890364 RepID=A0A2P6MTU9_9EUKA|nr:hypothetical protein PROFUN_03966 [Planoprotostelium fungivorum]
MIGLSRERTKSIPCSRVFPTQREREKQADAERCLDSPRRTPKKLTCMDYNPEIDIEQERGQEYSLYQQIDTTKIRCLNERVKGSAKNIFKPWNERLTQDKFLESDDDEELIIYIPFTASIKLKSFMIIGGNQGDSPKKLKIFTNREDVDFSNASSLKPVQEWDLQADSKGEHDIALFNSVSSITVFIPQNYGADNTKIFYLGLKGDFTPLARREAVITTYESKPQMSDHQASAEATFGRSVQ